jgi:DNA polymerase
MRAALTVLTEELRRLKAAGQATVVVPAESVARLQAAVARLGPRVERAATVTEVKAARETVAPERQAASRPKVAAEPQLPPPPVVKLVEGDKATQLAALAAAVERDPVRQAQAAAGKVVGFGAGSVDAAVVFCVDAPEEAGSEASVLLAKMIATMQLTPEQVYLTSFLSWRVPEGRDPTEEELAYNWPWVEAQVAIVKPQVIVALGANAARGVLGAGAFKKFPDVKGQWHTFAGVPVMVTYHPSYVVRNKTNRAKRQVWEDLLLVMERLGLPITEKQRGYFK